MAIHRNLTGADLHEPKGADTALAGMVYVADGAGSGTWVAASSVVTNSAWSTGDVKLTHKSVADATWIMWSDGTIGDASSGATVRANADTQALFVYFWGYYNNTTCPVSGGRGASAAADYAAHKTIGLPPAAGRVFGLAGQGSGLTLRVAGSVTGSEGVVLTRPQLPGFQPLFVGDTANLVLDADRGDFVVNPSGTPPSVSLSAGSGGRALGNDATIARPRVTATFTPSGVISTLGSDQPHPNMQPTAFVNAMIKL